MNFDPFAWSWPQWVIATLLFFWLASAAVQHGKPMLDGDKQPMKWSFPAAVVKFLFWGFFLVAGGFFGVAQ